MVAIYAMQVAPAGDFPRRDPGEIFLEHFKTYS
jgi:hypothetical protein